MSATVMAPARPVYPVQLGSPTQYYHNVNSTSPPSTLPSPTHLAHSLSSPLTYASTSSPASLSSVPSGTTLVSHQTGVLGGQQLQRVAHNTASQNTLRSPVCIELPDLEGLVACRTSQSVEGTTAATRRQIKGPRQIAEPWETYSPTAGQAIEVATPASQTLGFTYYIEDTLPTAGPWSVQRIIDKPGKDEDGKDTMLKEIVTQLLNPPPVNADDPTQTYPSHWKYSLDRGQHWKSVFPGDLRMPSRVHQLQLSFSFAEDIVSLADFHRDLSDHHGRVRMQIPGDTLQGAVRAITGQKAPEDELTEKKHRLFILTTSINVVQRRFNLPIQFDMQLYSVPVEGVVYPHFLPPELVNPINPQSGKQRFSCLSNASHEPMCVPTLGFPVTWLASNIPNSHYFKTGLAQSTHVADASKAVVNSKYTACPVLPDTNSDAEQLVSGISTFSRHPMFPRWIFVDRAKVEEELLTYTLWDKHSVYYRVPCPSNNLEAKVRDVEKGKFVQFICLDEWARMCQYWETSVKSEQNKSEPVIESERSFQQQQWGTYRTCRGPEETQPHGSMHDQLYFYVPKPVLKYFVDQKFTDDTLDQTYLMNKDRYLMRVDTPVYLELTLPHSNTTAVLAQLAKMAKENPQRAWFVKLRPDLLNSLWILRRASSRNLLSRGCQISTTTLAEPNTKLALPVFIAQMSHLDDCALVSTGGDSEYDREPLFQELKRLMSLATNHLLSVKQKRDLGADFHQEQIALMTNLLGQFQEHNAERYPGSITTNDVIFTTLAQLWYCQYGRKHHFDQGEKLLRMPSAPGSTVPKLAHYARFLIDVCTKVAVIGCRHAPLLANVEQLPATLVTYPRFPSRDMIVELMHDVSFVVTCVLRRSHEALKKGLTEMEMLAWELLTPEQQKLDRNKYQFQPSTSDLVQKRTFLTHAEIPALQGWMWKEQAASYVERFIPLCTNVFAQVECEYRLLEAFRVNSQKWNMPFQARENAHLWLNKKFTLEQAETLFKNLREFTCEHHLPMGMRIHRKRARSSTITPIDADLVMQHYLGTAVTLKITSVFQNEVILAAIAGEPAHPLYGYLFLAMLDLEWSRIAGKREKLLYLYADYVVPSSLFLFRPIEEEERPGQLRHNQFPRPRIMMVCGEWKVLYEGQWQEATTGTCKDLIDALLLMLLIIRDDFDNTLENDMDLSDLTFHFLPALRAA